MIELTKLPIPLPSVVLLLEIVGPVVVPQHTPLAVINPPPSTVIFPPDVAVVEVITVTAAVVRIDRLATVVNWISFPYPVPTLLVA